MTKAAQNSSMKQVTLASLFGTTLEFYDHFIYGSAAALIFPHVFFVNLSHNLALLLSLITYGVAFIGRPLGALIFGHFGDKLGRKNVLVLALLIMGISTFLIACLPNYQQAGAFGAYALCVLRILQGIALGGEWGGAALMVNEFAASSKYKSLLGSIVQTASPLGFLLASGVFAAVSNWYPHESLLNYGWRIPFFLSLFLVVIGLYMRRKISESPEFSKLSRQENFIPLAEIIKYHLKPCLLAIGIRIGSDSAFYVFALFPLVYLPMLGVSKEIGLSLGICAALGQIIGTPLFGYLSDKYGTRFILSIGALINAAWVFLYIFLLQSGQAFIIIASGFISLFLLSILWAPLASHLPSMFPARIRYTGTSIGFQTAGILGGAIAPSICLLLLENFHNAYTIAVYLSALLLISFVCTGKTQKADPDTSGS